MPVNIISIITSVVPAITGKKPIAISIMLIGMNKAKFIARGILINKPIMKNNKKIDKHVKILDPNTYTVKFKNTCVNIEVSFINISFSP